LEDDDDDDDDDDDVDINTDWDIIRENMKASATKNLRYYELKQHKPRCDEDCSQLLDEAKWVKLQRLQNRSQTNGDNLNNVRSEASRNTKKKTERISGRKNNELETNRKNKHIRDTYGDISE